jgi:hypothetical protein
MRDNKEKFQEECKFPPKPIGRWNNALLKGAIGIALGALWGKMVGGKIGNSNTTSIQFGSTILGVVGLLDGYSSGKAAETEHTLTVKNIKLNDRVHELEAGGSHSFAKQVAESDTTQECKTR